MYEPNAYPPNLRPLTTNWLATLGVFVSITVFITATNPNYGPFFAGLPLFAHLCHLVGRWKGNQVEPKTQPLIALDCESVEQPADSLNRNDCSGPGLVNDMARLRLIAAQDALTGLSNRSHFKQIVEQHIQSANDECPHCLLFIDLDGFKKVNDSLGHSQGDKLLIACADRLRLATTILPSDDDDEVNTQIEIGRFGGDEFVVFVGNNGTGNTAQRLSRRILRVLSDPFHLGARSVQIGASIGVAFSPDLGVNFDELVRRADTAMYQAKGLGRNNCEFFSDALLANTRQAELEENEVREAFVRGEFELYFQPLFDARTMEITSAEALLRWRHPRRGLLLPSSFFQAIDRANMNNQVGEWVINEVTRKISELDRAGTPLMIAANVSPTQLEDIEFTSLVRSCVSRWKCPPEMLQLEITEDTAMRDPEMTARSLSRLNEIGISVAIDDFGTGYSNLANLITLPLSRLKIDRSLLHSIDDSPEGFILVQTIINLSNSLGFHSVAEGVESEEQQHILQSMGCDILQGFLLSHPISFEKLRLLCIGTSQKRNLPDPNKFPEKVPASSLNSSHKEFSIRRKHENAI